MAKYSIVELKIKDRKLIDLELISKNEKKALKENNAIYIYRGTKSKKYYIGKTTCFIERHRSHYAGNEEKFNTGDFNQVIVIFSSLLNGSALDDVESQFITYFSADKPKSNRTNVEYDKDDIVNRTAGNRVNEYQGRENVTSEVIIPVWEKELFKKGWVTTPKLEELRTRELVKYSPIKVLTNEQGDLIKEIISNPDKSYVINGDAGTGKTVLLTHLVASILNDRKDARVGVVVQPNWEKIGKNIFKVYGINNNRLSVMTSTKLITTAEVFDVIIVDESHKMSRKYGKQQPSFNKVYKDEAFYDIGSHLEIIQKLGNQIILMYDTLQAIRPANVTRDMFEKLTTTYEKRFLKTQFRIQTPHGKTYTSDDYINGIKYLLYKDTGLLDSKLTNYDPLFNKDLFRDKSDDAYFGYVMEQPLHSLIDWLEEDNIFNPEHINRVLAGLVEKWNQPDGKDITITHWHEGDIDRRWNSKQENWINSNDADAAEQIGSVFAVQGIDLNKVGVLIGNDIEVDSNGHLTANPNNFFNQNGTFTNEEMEIEENQFEFTLFVLNIYYVLLTRGIDGIRLGFWKNDAFRKYMEKTLEIC